jgi:hypothetical protein
MVLSESSFNVTANFMDEACEPVCKDAQGEPVGFPLSDMLEFTLLPEACQECVVVKGWEAIRAGRQALSFFSTLAQAKSFLGDMIYQVRATN